MITERDEKGRIKSVDNTNHVWKPEDRPGRPTVMTEEILNKIEMAFSIGATQKEALMFAGISEVPLKNFLKNNPEYREKIEMLKLKPIFKARQEVVKGLEGNPEFSMKFLEKKLRDEFGNYTKLDIETAEEEKNPIAEVLKKQDGEKRKQTIELLAELLGSGDKGGDISDEPTDINQERSIREE